MNIEDREHHLRTFEALLYDSVYLLYFAFDTNQDDYPDDIISPFIRSSIMNSMLLLECGANCLIDALDLPSKFYNDIEKLPFLSKFEYFLSTLNNNAFDRGCKEVQAISELKSIRDFYVHPKVKKGKYEHVVDNYWVVEYGKTTQLGFPRAPDEWGKEHAIIALQSVCNFYNKYFIEWCKLEADAVIDLLLSNEKVDISQPIGAAIDCVGGLDRAAKEWKINFSFLGKNV
ncbi:MAG: hypothetical protein ACSHXL_07430 [Bacteroidota bacterium]